MRRLALMPAVLVLAGGCAMDMGGMLSSKSDPAPAPQIAAAPPPQPQSSYETTQSTTTVPPSGQSAFTPAPQPGLGMMLQEVELKATLPGHTVMLEDGTVLQYGPSGSFTETRSGQPVAAGQYTIRDVSVCVQYVNGVSRCDSFVRDQGVLFIEDRFGARRRATVS